VRITELSIEGLRAAPSWQQADLGPAIALPLGPVGMAVADAIALLTAALDGPRCGQILSRMGLARGQEELFFDDRGFAEQVSGLDADEVHALLDPEAGRKVLVTARLALDPPLFGRLREQSLRDPKMLAALSERPSLLLKVGWLFTSDRTAASLGVLEVQVAKTSFPTGRSERPRWMDDMFRAVGGRLGGVGAGQDATSVGTKLLDAALSAEPELRARYARLADAMAHPPFSFGRLELVRRGDRVQLAFGADLVRARQLGPSALRALRLAYAALVVAPDVLVVEDDSATVWADWLTGLTDGDDATLEQVFWLPGPTR
jgi:hypothetical protein